jgi:integrase
MLLTVIGKRNKQRVLPLTDPTLAMLREVWKTHRHAQWLFPNLKGTGHLSTKGALINNLYTFSHVSRR